jgi:hypothetical protein
MVRSALQLRYVESDGSSPTQHKLWLHDNAVTGGMRRLPSEGFLNLYPASNTRAPNAWAPTDMYYHNVASFAPLINEDGVGIEEWEIVEHGHIPGILQVGLWVQGTTPTAHAPDETAFYPLDDTTDWTTGPLPVQEYAPSPPFGTIWTSPRIRWFPAHLRELVP